MDQGQRQFRAFENAIDSQAFVPGINVEFNEYIKSQTVVPAKRIHHNLTHDALSFVNTLIHQYTGTPGNIVNELILLTYNRVLSS